MANSPAILKEHAARRQIDAAIRMLFLHGEDLLAIHSVAAAARGILKDLAKKRGVGYEHQTRKFMEYLYGVDYGLDTSDPAIVAEIDQKSREIENYAWQIRNKAENFLKHSDRDSEKAFDVADLNTLSVISEAILFWDNLNLEITDEMRVYMMWFNAVMVKYYPDHDQHNHIINTKSGPIHLFTFEQQIEFGRYALKFAYKTRRRSTKQFRDDSLCAHLSGFCRK